MRGTLHFVDRVRGIAEAGKPNPVNIDKQHHAMDNVGPYIIELRNSLQHGSNFVTDARFRGLADRLEFRT